MISIPITDDFSNHNSKLPLIYKIELPPLKTQKAAIPLDAIGVGEVFPDLNDPLEMVRPFKSLLEWLSRQTNISLENLLERTAILMKSLHPEKDWNRAAEQKMKDWLEDIGLKIIYNRLRPMVTLHAISYVVAEMADANKLDFNQLNAAYDGLHLYEPTIAGKEPMKRISLLHRPKNIDGFESPKKWVQNRDEAFEYFVSELDDGAVIIGELSIFKICDWEVPTEKRLSLACHQDWVNASHGTGAVSDFFPYHPSWRANGYPMLRHTNKIPSLIVYGKPRQVLIGAKEWVAFNPEFGKRLGWHLSEEGTFRWLDENGQLMVESLWWQDGPVSAQPTRTRDIIGEGWLVLATKPALTQISDQYEQAIVWRLVKRSIKEPYQQGYEEAFSDGTHSLGR